MARCRLGHTISFIVARWRVVRVKRLGRLRVTVPGVARHVPDLSDLSDLSIWESLRLVEADHRDWPVLTTE